ncbi:MAG TPA: GTPase domain-containing protein [Kofleriaceae bacterium]|nr:GTPase domain-containing protein [Kofleriaceae bacterium]
MAQVDFLERQLTLKLVYYGPPLSGKTSNLRALHDNVDKLNRGRLMTLDTRDDRTLFFDLLPIFFRTSSFSFRIKVYTVPGQPTHEATRKIVLAGADGVVFVADSSPAAREANRAAWHNLVGNLHAFALDQVPIVVQYNKRDLPDGVPIAEVDRFGEPDRPVFEAIAKRGDGVVATFFALVGDAWDHLDRDLQLGSKLGIDSQAFRRSLAEHVGVGIDATMTR